MKRMTRVAGILAIVLGISMIAGVCQATPLAEQSELLRSCLRYERSLTTPDDFPASQRTLLAVSLAAAEMRTTDPKDILELYLVASQQVEDRLKRETEYAWNETAWDETHRTTNTYDGANNLTETLWEDMVGSSWVNSALESNTYDGSGRLLTATNQNWAVDHWENESLYTYEYDGSGNISRMTMQEWDADEWVYSMRITIAYTGGRMATSTTEFWMGDDWVNFARSTYSYDGSDRLTQILTELWGGSAWGNSSRITYTYDGNGHVTQILTEVWGGTNWGNSSLITYTYDGNGNTTESLSQYWQGGEWVNTGKNEYTYDGSGNEIIDVYSSWIGTAWSVRDVDSSKYAGGKLVEVVHNVVSPVPELSHTLYMYDGDNLVEEIDQIWSTTALIASSWVNVNRTTYEYEAGSSAVLISDAPAPAGYELNQNYPNPFNPSTSIRYSLQRTSLVEVTVYNMLGQAIKTLESGIQAPGVYETTWDGTDATGHAVASGVYLYRVATDDFTETRKMMLLK